MEDTNFCLLPYTMPFARFHYDIIRSTSSNVHQASGKLCISKHFQLRGGSRDDCHLPA